jgi:hypothetical protein
MSTRISDSFLAKSFVAIGEMELMSTTVEPGFTPSATPSFPNRTSSTSGVSGTMTKMRSETLATALLLGQETAPFATTSLTESALRSKTLTLCPAASRCPTMGLPMIPSPMNPSAVTMHLL